MSRVERFSFAERTAHWLSALLFVYAALSGLALWSHRMYWMADVLGGRVTVRSWHPWAGVFFAIALAVMFRNWFSAMRLDDDDRAWLRLAHRYAVHDEEGLPPSGRFNAGQKLLFWFQSAATIVLLASGVVLWFPEAIAREWRLAAILIHPAAAMLAIAGIILHIYMGTAAVPGAFRGMLRGFVTEDWAAAHHPKWHRETKETKG